MNYVGQIGPVLRPIIRSIGKPASLFFAREVTDERGKNGPAKSYISEVPKIQEQDVRFGVQLRVNLRINPVGYSMEIVLSKTAMGKPYSCRLAHCALLRGGETS